MYVLFMGAKDGALPFDFIPSNPYRVTITIFLISQYGPLRDPILFAASLNLSNMVFVSKIPKISIEFSLHIFANSLCLSDEHSPLAFQTRRDIVGVDALPLLIQFQLEAPRRRSGSTLFRKPSL